MTETFTSYLRLGRHHENRRLWLEGRRLETNGFLPGLLYRTEWNADDGTLTLMLDDDGTTKVHRKSAPSGWMPVIDITNRLLGRFFKGAETLKVIFGPGRITVTLSKIERNRAARFHALLTRLRSGSTLTFASLCHGGGILDAAIHTGFADGAVPLRMIAACEKELSHLEASLCNNSLWRDGAKSVEADLMAIAAEDLKSPGGQSPDILIAGLPCTGASVAGQSARHLVNPEDHPEAGHLFIGLLQAIEAVQPGIVILENVPEYGKSFGCAAIREVLTRKGYEIAETILHGNRHGAIEARSRLCLVATTGFRLDLSDLDRETLPSAVAGILDDIPPDHPAWSKREWLWKRVAENKERGLRFEPRLVGPEDTHIPTITAGYAKIRGYEPMLKHPTDPTLTRLFTPAEHARLKTVPEELIHGLAASTAHEILGQGVIFEAFRALGRRLATVLGSLDRTTEVHA